MQISMHISDMLIAIIGDKTCPTLNNVINL